MKNFLIIFSLLFGAQALGVQDVEPMAKKVIELRQEVELLNEDYKSRREEIVNKLKALTVQKAELESNIRSENVRKKQLNEKIGGLKSQINEDTVISNEIVETFKKGIEQLRASINGSLPFKKNERLQALNDLENKIKAKEISAIRAANVLWTLFEDERRLARETNLFKQTIEVDGKMLLML